MTAGMFQVRQSGAPRALRRGLLCSLAVVCAWAGTVPTMAPAATAAPGQTKQWHLDAMGAEDIWKVSTGKGVKVAVIDTGVNPTTPSLQGQVLDGLDASGAKGEETDDYDGHGTTMAELIAGTGKGGGIRGLAPGAKIVPMRIADTDLQNREKTNAQATIDAIRAAADSDVKIISMSFSSDFSSRSERAAVEYAAEKGKLFFAAAGNNAKEGNKPQFPAAYPDVVGVASADSKGTVAEYSQHGDNVDLTAPGRGMPSWCDKSFKAYCDGDGGTSSATAIASASAALVWSAHPDWTANQVLRALIDTAGRDWAKGTRSTYLGHGLIRPRQILVDGKGDPGAPDVSPLTNQKTGGAPASTAPSAPASSQPPKGDSQDGAVVAGSSKNKSEDGGSSTGLIIGGIAAVVVVAGGAFFLLRRRAA
ncbi:S8 family serine peptidase [Streptomyces sp. NPDC020412]|uniref:S8 family serine peptidase n=1 Tax=Streptomyces sp. NPDC020412 TaxID=3365073 RepID=UPI003798390E